MTITRIPAANSHQFACIDLKKHMLGSYIQILTTPDEFDFVQPLKFIVPLVRYKGR